MLNIKGKRILLSVHLVLISIWLGALVAILYLNFLKGSIKTGDQLYAINWTIFKIHDNVLMNAAFGVIATGLLFSLFTKWGFFKFRWLTIKWAAIVLLFILIAFILSPSINGMAAHSDVERIQVLSNPQYLRFENKVTLFVLIQLVVLGFIVVISVFKPWGQRKKQFKMKRKIILTIGGVFGIFLLISLSMQYMQLNYYRNLPINDLTVQNISDGIYAGESNLGFNYRVQVAVENQKIKNIEIIKNRNSLYAKFAEGVAEKVLQAQSLNVDGVTGATTTSKCLLKALENAIESGLNK